MSLKSRTAKRDSSPTRRGGNNRPSSPGNETADALPHAGARPKAPHARGKETTPSEKVYNFILNRILTREWPVNTKILTEPELCAALDVSRMAVREAVERLCALGLLVKKQGSGTFVTEPNINNWLGSTFPAILTSERDLRQLLEFRRFFEYGNVLLFMQYADADDIAALENNYQEMVACAASAPERAGTLDYEFHQAIARGTKNKFIMKISDILIEIMRSHREARFYNSISLGNAIIYHNEIIRAMRNGDGEIAAMLMRRHIDIAIDYYDQSFRTAAGGPAAGND